ncbi:acyl-coenzyme A:6-aminopenicillanic acid acyl-transferase-domain-containing protein [Xylariales sp. PMI_506]|nr:acyl-coenzyme A:6-aminopenicillanic acid acyl-transferase-domain-containing protein [Xylariales sp. PMI_506]
MSKKYEVSIPTLTAIGLTHGRRASEQIRGSIAFYGGLFERSCGLTWPEVRREAERYVAPLEILCPRYLDEIRGIADGAGLAFLDILALNVRTEINFGLFTVASSSSYPSSFPPHVAAATAAAAEEEEEEEFPSDGCTSVAWRTEASGSWLGQNWDWKPAQAPNLVVCRISQPGTGIPDLAMVTEAGIIGKIGLNAAGVGCCLNAIRCRGVDPSKLPIHFALRAALESSSRAEAVARISSFTPAPDDGGSSGGVAGSGHILLADPGGSVGLECTAIWVRELAPAADGKLSHTNHLLLEHGDVDERPWLADSPARLTRARRIVAELTEPTEDALFELFKDGEGYPASINRRQAGDHDSQTLFTIIMDLSNRRAKFTFGRPTEFHAQTILAF